MTKNFDQSLTTKMSSTSSLPKSVESSLQESSSSSNSQPNEKQRVNSSVDISANISQLTIDGDISPILSHFECCVCLEFINPPILQCRNSHLFCQSCREKFKSPAKCPTCRVELRQADIRNHLLEQMAHSLGLPFPCKYSSNGCDVTSLLTEKAKHEELCGYGPYKCPHVCGNCQWLGSREEVAQHLKDKHKFYIKQSHFHNWILNIDAKNDSQIWGIILSLNDQKFIFIRKFDSTPKLQFKAIVLCIGEQRIADQFKYKIEVFNESNGTRLLWEDKPISIRSDVKSLLSFDQNNGLNLEKNMISRLWFDNTFNVKLTIESETY